MGEGPMKKRTNKTWKDVENLCRKNNISPQDALTIVWCEKTKNEVKKTENELQLKWARHRLKEVTKKIDGWADEKTN